MILTSAYSSSFGISFVMKECDNVVIIQSEEKRTRYGSLYVTSIYLYAITISYCSVVRYKNIDKPIIVEFHKPELKLYKQIRDIIFSGFYPDMGTKNGTQANNIRPVLDVIEVVHEVTFVISYFVF